MKNMGRVAAYNMTGGDEAVSTFGGGALTLTEDGELDSPYWHYD